MIGVLDDYPSFEKLRESPRRHASQSGRCPVSDPSLVWEAAAANERLGPLAGLWFESVAARSTR
jgi:hypothetical protein